MQGTLDLFEAVPEVRETGLRPVLELVIYGRPAPQGSKRGFVVHGRAVLRDDSHRTKPWKGQIAQLAGERWAGRQLLDGPLAFELTFYLARPRSHFKRDGSLGAVGRRKPYPTGKPDTTKLVRAVEDALKGVVWTDDSRVVAQLNRKRYGEPERAEIRVFVLPGGTA